MLIGHLFTFFGQVPSSPHLKIFLLFKSSSYILKKTVSHQIYNLQVIPILWVAFSLWVVSFDAHTTDFCVNCVLCDFAEFIWSSSFLMDSLEFFYIGSSHRWIFYFFLSNLDVVSLSCLVRLAQPSSTMFSSNGDSRCPCLVPDLGGKNLQSLTRYWLSVLHEYSLSGKGHSLLFLVF